MEGFLRTPYSRFYLNYRYMMTPAQLIFLCERLREASNVGNYFIEIGCGFGDTTVFLNKFMADIGVKARYRVIDTFQGFTEHDVAHEVLERGTDPRISRSFKVNDVRWFRRRMEANGLDVDAVAMDATLYRYEDDPPLAFCLLDIDLYGPTQMLLPALYRQLLPGGIIIVDDCDCGHRLWNGAYHAYAEFCKANGLRKDIHCRKLGVIHKPSA